MMGTPDKYDISGHMKSMDIQHNIPDIHLVGGLEHEFDFPIYWECHHHN